MYQVIGVFEKKNCKRKNVNKLKRVKNIKIKKNGYLRQFYHSHGLNMPPYE